MKKAKKESASTLEKKLENLTLGEYTYQVIQEQTDHLFKQEDLVLQDTDPEPLHQMRVASRRLRTALQIFAPAVEIPKASSAKQLRDLARVLGEVRDLDVQIASLQDYYWPQLGKSEQKPLKKLIATLQQQRMKAFSKMKSALTGDRYAELKQAYQDWLKQPQYQAIATLPIMTLLPDLLTPLLSQLLLHPGWLVSTEAANGANGVILHDLRKVCKHVRYEAEFFTELYNKDFQKWIKQIKALQDSLGEFQDTQVLWELLSKRVSRIDSLPELQAAIQQKQTDAMSGWDTIRQEYLQPEFRYHLHQMLSQSTPLQSLPLQNDATNSSLALN
ncbi:MAG: CHAD domain-containing protein [Leptolyngbyaceae cyanobacterium CRU_2_3]|nr:CHAD domain-containing protein [Leptolyngbyaceae cyanobacterium CRU_2_3]